MPIREARECLSEEMVTEPKEKEELTKKRRERAYAKARCQKGAWIVIRTENLKEGW